MEVVGVLLLLMQGHKSVLRNDVEEVYRGEVWSVIAYRTHFRQYNKPVDSKQ